MDRTTVLLVDDNQTSLDTTETFLRVNGVEVVALSSPFGATKMVQRCNPDLIVLDVMMPGLSGSGLATVIRKESPVPIIFFSAMPEESLRDLAVQTPRASYVLKSEGVLYLLDEIQRILKRPGIGMVLGDVTL